MKKILLILTILSFGIALEAYSKKIKTVTLCSPTMDVKIMNFGARIQSLEYNGTDVALGFDTLQQYVDQKQNFGAIVGRYIGRILGGHLEIDGQTYQLMVEDNGDCCHGGKPSYSKRFWKFVSHNDTTATLRYVSPDGENGFPGELTLDCTYTLTRNNSLRVDFKANTTKPTVLNVSNHTFFNLSGDHGSDILSEELWLESDSVTTYNKKKQVDGKMISVEGTPFDFNTPHAIGERIDANNEQIKITKGYDQCYQLKNNGDISKPIARLTDNKTNISMEVYTTEPAVQVYTANSHKGNMIGKGGKPHIKRNGICLETMHFPDSPNNPQWPSTLLRPNETYQSTTIFHFN